MILSKFGRFVNSVSNWFAKAGAVLIIVVLLVSVIDVLGSNIFNMPILGVTEIVSLFLGVVIALAIARAQISKRHIRVEVFTSRLPKRIQAIIDSIISPILLAFFVILTWQTFVLAISYQAVGEYSITLHLPIPYFIFAMAVAFIGACLVFLLEFLNSLKEAGRK